MIALITFKKVTQSDLPQLLALSRETFFDAFLHLNNPADMALYAAKAFDEQNFRAELSNPSSEFYFALLDDAIAGYLKLNFNDAQTEFCNPCEMEVERIYVTATHQRKQIGQQLLDFALDTGRIKKLQTIWLGVWENNHQAIRFYQRNGFTQFNSHYFMLGNDKQTDLLLKRAI